MKTTMTFCARKGPVLSKGVSKSSVRQGKGQEKPDVGRPVAIYRTWRTTLMAALNVHAHLK